MTSSVEKSVFLEMYKGVDRLSPTGLHENLLETAEKLGIMEVVETMCQNNFGHKNPLLLEGADRRYFFDLIDPLVAFVLEKKPLIQ